MKCPLTERGCGGCIELAVPYGEHLKHKQAAFVKLFPNALPIVGMEDPRHYRAKVLSTFANGRSGLYSGIYAAGSHRVLSVRDCILHDKRADEIIGAVREMLAQTGLKAYDEDAGTGTLRHMLVRRAAGTGEVLLTLVTPSDVLPDGRSLAAEIVRLCPDVRSVVQNVNPRKTSAVLGFREHVLYGPGYVDDLLMDTRFRISSRSFYQVNSRQTEKLYGKALALANLSGRETVLDAYCGVGTIGILAAKQAAHVTGVEFNADAVKNAVTNARLNGLSNIDFLRGDAGRVLAEKRLDADVVFLDPPRAGCERPFLEALCAAKPQTVVYVSCCPETQARDVKLLTRRGYTLQSVQPVDMFPFTPHVETVCLLSKLQSKEHIEIEVKMDELDLTAAEKKATYEEIKAYVLEHNGLKVSHLYIAQVKQKYGIIERENYNKPKSENAKQPQCPPEKEEAITEALKHFGMIL